ncbi:RIP metalloprotease RseP [Pedobacter antarcticus]|uniref:Zinc metalloprotease n=2 Tax=Pedobacter antarcticus TaxID=34086 RepID=A0A081PFA9_9SPHI|nr:RIP metalloprotease RseP [Pedobacter antarcticus]KEQ29382.1 peptidase [Pedobacter antarcticus 4BY]SDM66639.1 regulator of sigma E protease [Pedobacter antarcticus]SFF40454.1 site-2 protease. Metallo peptidase. MEROPS family M50B [Pedobacter antarcticus]
MNGLIMVAQLLLGLSILVILHELGHFLAARAFGIKVEKFYLFFDAWGFKLFSIKRGGVEYGIGWLPLGGYVKIAGMIDESMDKEQMALPPQPWEFRSKPAWQRLIVMLGGVFVNIVVGIFIFWMLAFKFGDTYIPNSSVKNGINVGVIGKEIGLKDGDHVLAINGKKVIRFDEITSSNILLSHTTLTIDRSGKTLEVKIPDNILNKVADLGLEELISRTPLRLPKLDTIIANRPAAASGLLKGDLITSINGKAVKYDADVSDALKAQKNKEVQIDAMRDGVAKQFTVKTDSLGTIGIGFTLGDLKLETIQYGFFQALPIGVNQAWVTFTDNAKGISKVLTGKIKADKAFSGPVAIAQKVYGGVWVWSHFWASTALISIALAFMNLLPIPALDGGHVVFLIVEMIKGKPLGDKFMEGAQMVGFVILLCLMVFVLGNDIFKAFIK